MKATVSLPNSPDFTTPLGVGLATLMREPSAARQQRLLQAAYDAGFRHFDVAPSYGMGAAEQVLGRFLKTRPEGVTVGTKVGISVRGGLAKFRLFQRPARAILRAFPALRGRATSAVGTAIHVRSNFSLDACTRSLEASLRALKREVIDLLLLHDPEPEDLSSGQAFEWLAQQKGRGVVRNIGVATSAQRAAQLASSGAYDVIQVPSSILSPCSQYVDLSRPTPLAITHSAMAEPLRRIARRIEEDPKWAESFSSLAGIDVRARRAVAPLLLNWALTENNRGIVLVGASTAEHFRAAANAMQSRGDANTERVGAFLRATLSQESFRL